MILQNKGKSAIQMDIMEGDSNLALNTSGG